LQQETYLVAATTMKCIVAVGEELVEVKLCY